MATPTPFSPPFDASASMLQALVNETTDSIFVKDRSGRYLLFNRSAAQVCGVSAAAVLGRTDHELFSPAEAERLVDADRRVLETGAPLTLEEHLSSAGVSRIYSTTKAPWINEQGEILGVIGIARDITAQKQHEAELNWRHQLNLQMEMLAGVGCYEWRIAENYLFGSAEFYRLLGISAPPAAATLEAYLERVHASDRPGVGEIVAQALRTCGKFHMEARVVRSDSGEVRLLETRGRVVADANGQPLRLIGACRDITAQKQAEADLRRSEARYRAFVDHAGDAMFLHRHGGEIIDVNQQACDCLGYSREELLGRLPFFDPSLSPEKIAWVTQQFQQRELVTFETTHRRKDGAEFPVEVRIRSFSVDDERFSVSLVSNITERRRMTQALQDERTLLRTLIDAAPDVIYTKDSQGRYVVSNQAHHQFIADGNDSAVNKTARDFCPPDVAESIAADDRRILSGETPLLHREEEVLGSSRGWHWRQVVKAPLKNADGRIVGLVGISRDIQNLKDAEAGLRGSEQRLRGTLDSLLEGCQIIGFDYRYLYLNDSAARQARRAAAEVIGRTMEEAYPGIVQTPLFAAVRRVMERRVSETLENEFTFPDGETGLFEVSLQPVPEGVFILTNEMTARRRAEAQLLKSEERYRLAVNHSQVVVWEADMAGNFVYVSPFAAELLGFPLEQWLSPGFWRGRLHPGDAQWAAEYCFDQSRLGIDHRLEYRLVHSSGRIVWVDDIVQVVQKNGRPVSLRGVLIDVTEHKRTEAITLAKNRVLEQIAQGVELQEILRQINHLVESCQPNSACSFLLLDESGRAQNFIAADRLPREFLDAKEGSCIGPNSEGCAKAAFAGQPVIIAEIAADPRAACFRDVALHYGIRACWCLPVYASAERRPEAGQPSVGTIAVYLDKPGEPTAADLEALRQATHLAGIAISRERALRRFSESQRFIQAITDASPSVLYVYDLTTQKLVFVSRQVAAELGYSAEEIAAIGLGSILTLMHPEDQAQMPQRFARWLQAGDGEAIETEYRLRTKDGGYRWFLSRDTVFARGPDGGVLQLVGIAQNITTRKMLEEHLRQSQKMEAIGRLAGGVAHDFNNLLTVVRSATELMLAQVDAKHPFHNDLELVLRATERGASLTQRLLAFGRRQEWSLEPLDVNQTILDLQPLLQRAVGRGVRLTYNLTPNLPLIRGDAVGLEQALLNLALNARDAMPDGGSLVISTRLMDPVPKPQAAPGPPAVWIEVQDTGSGIDPAALPHIFDPFFTTKAVGTGAGLGLAVLHGIISQFGGAVAVESQPGAGALFRLSFPAL